MTYAALRLRRQRSTGMNTRTYVSCRSVPGDAGRPWRCGRRRQLAEPQPASATSAPAVIVLGRAVARAAAGRPGSPRRGCRRRAATTGRGRRRRRRCSTRVVLRRLVEQQSIASRSATAPPVRPATVGRAIGVTAGVGALRRLALRQSSTGCARPPSTVFGVSRSSVPSDVDLAAVDQDRRPAGRPGKLLVIVPISSSGLPGGWRRSARRTAAVRGRAARRQAAESPSSSTPGSARRPARPRSAA